MSNFLTLLIMIIIIIAVYKSCNKNRENDLRREINTSFAHMGGVEPSQAEAANYYSNFPQPPPPYGLVVDANSAPSMPSTQMGSMPPTTTASQSYVPPLAGYKPEQHQAADPGLLNDPTSVTVNAQATQGSAGWSSFLTGAAVGGVTGFLLNRRK